MRLYFLGTKGIEDKGNEEHNKDSSLLIEHSDKSILINWGESHKDETLPDVDWVLLTHGYLNCVGGITKEKFSDTPIYMNRSTAEILKDVGLKNTVIFNDDAVETYELGPFTVTTIPAMHSINNPVTSYKVKGDNTLLYCSNVLWIRNRTEAFKGVDVYVGDGTNQSRSIVRKQKGDIYGSASILAQLKWCKIEDVERAIFTHFGTDTISDGDDTSIRLVTSKFKNDVEFIYATDGMRLDTRTFEKLQKITFISECPKCGFIFSSDINPEEKELKCPKCGGICKMFRGDNPPDNVPYIALAKEEKDWIHLSILVPTREDLGRLLFFEKELLDMGVTFDCGWGSGIRDWELDWSFKAPKGITREKILSMLKKKGFKFEVKKVERKDNITLKITNGIYFKPSTARMIIEENRKAFIKTRRFDIHRNEPLYLLGDNYCFGVIKYSVIRDTTLKELKKLYSLHGITGQKLDKNYSGAKNLYLYLVDVLETYDPPRHYKREMGIQTFVEDVIFLEDIVTLPRIEETENEIWARIQSPGKYDSASFRRKPFPPKNPIKGVFALYACPKGNWSGGRCQVGVQIQAMRFVKKDGWTIERVRAWLKRHKLEEENALHLENIKRQDIEERIKLTKLKQKLVEEMMK